MSTILKTLPTVVLLGSALLLAYMVHFRSKRSVPGSVDGRNLMTLNVPAAVLETAPVTKSETITMQKKNGLGVFSNRGSKVEVEATYRHQVVLKETWSFVFDSKRKVAFIIMPNPVPILPVEFKIVRDKKVIGGFDVDSKWFWKFEDKEQIKERVELLQKLNARLANNAASASIVKTRMEEARRLVESHIRSWLIRKGHCRIDENLIVKVCTYDDHASFPLPDEGRLQSFQPK